MTVLSRPGIPLGLSCWLAAALVWSLSGGHASHALAQPIPVAAATSNAYWAGYVSTQGAPFSGVEASWAVPSIACPRNVTSNATAYVWIGEGGYLQGLNSSLVQAGTASDCVGGVERYHAFYEWYPGIYATDFPISVHPGDIVHVRIDETQPNYWTLSAADLTTGSRSATATYFQADTGSADLIVERPTVCSASGCGQLPLAGFGQVTFQGVRVTGSGGEQPGDVGKAISIALVDPDSQRILAQPGKLRSAPDDAAVIWRASQ